MTICINCQNHELDFENVKHLCLLFPASDNNFRMSYITGKKYIKNTSDFISKDVYCVTGAA
jgi:hypothetical protein